MRRVAMINPTIEDIWRNVITFGKFGDQLLLGYGHIESFTDREVFVSFGGDPVTLLREDLDWAETERTSLASSIEDVEPQSEIDRETLSLPFESLTADRDQHAAWRLEHESPAASWDTGRASSSHRLAPSKTNLRDLAGCTGQTRMIVLPSRGNSRL